MRHKIRCGLCNKFITDEDQRDDGICESCAERLDWLASRRVLRWQLITYALAIANLIIVIANLIIVFWR